MSDTDTQPSGRPKLQFDDMLADGERVSRDKMVKEIFKKIPHREIRMVQGLLARNRTPGTAPQTGGADRDVFNLAEKLVDLIPEEYHTTEFIEQGDIRPLLQQVLTNPAEGLADPSGTTTIQGTEFTGRERAIAAYLLPGMTEHMREQLIEGLAVNVNDPEQTQIVDNMLSEYRQGVVKALGTDVALTQDPQTGEMAVAPGSGGAGTSFQEALLGLNDEGRTSRRFITDKEWRSMLRAGTTDFRSMQLMAEQTQDQGAFVTQDGTEEIWRPQVRFDNTVDRDRMPMPGDSNAAMSAEPMQREAEKWYGLSEILRKPYDLKREEALELTKKMRRAGLFDLVGGEPTVPGDVTDPQFKAAWEHLATMSLEKNKPMMSILEERMSAYEREVMANMSVQLTDPARIKLNANALGTDMIGRHLTDDEHAELAKFVHDLQRRNAMIEAGLEETSDPDVDYADVEGLQEGVIADIDAQMEEFMRQQNPGEAGARDIADQYEVFTRILGGPGRGVR